MYWKSLTSCDHLTLALELRKTSGPSLFHVVVIVLSLAGSYLNLSESNVQSCTRYIQQSSTPTPTPTSFRCALDHVCLQLTTGGMRSFFAGELMDLEDSGADCIYDCVCVYPLSRPVSRPPPRARLGEWWTYSGRTSDDWMRSRHSDPTEGLWTGEGRVPLGIERRLADRKVTRKSNEHVNNQNKGIQWQKKRINDQKYIKT